MQPIALNTKELPRLRGLSGRGDRGSAQGASTSPLPRSLRPVSLRYAAVPVLGLAVALTSSCATGGGAATAAPSAQSPSAPSSGAAPATGAATPATSAVSTPATTTPVAAPPSAPAAGTGGKIQTGDVTLGEWAVVGFYASSGAPDDGATPMRMRITITEGRISDLAGFNLDAQSKQAQPFYVSYEIVNQASRPLETAGFGGRLLAYNAAGDQASRIGLIGDFPKCDGNPPDSLAPAASAKGCEVFLVPNGQRVVAAGINSGPDYEKLTWK